MPWSVVRCTVPGCAKPASTKVAAPWSSGRFRELTTYGFACSEHLPSALRRAHARPQPALDEGESMDAIGSYPIATD